VTSRDTASKEPASLERRIQEVGQELSQALQSVVEQVPGGPHGPGSLAKDLKLDKVFTSRLLKALRSGDGVACLHAVPGPDPLGRFLRAARRRGVDGAPVAAAQAAVEAFDELIRRDIGDRSALTAIISCWLPEAREEFELRRKQAAFKAMSQLKGVEARVNLGAVFLHPSRSGERIDVVWVLGQLGLRRLRPGARARFVTRRMTREDGGRRPTTLSGESAEGLDRVRLDQFCQAPPAPVEAHRFGDVMHYTLAGEGFGQRSESDLIFGEVNLEEMPRYVERGARRKAYVFSEVHVPAKTLFLDLFVHDELFVGQEPATAVYDTATDGVVNINDPARSLDQFDTQEVVQSLGHGTSRIRMTAVPNYVDLVRHVYGELGWDEARFRAFRCRVDYPIYGSQVVLAFDAVERPE